MRVEISDELGLELLVKRVKVWETNENVISLFEKMYSNDIEAGMFENSTFDINQIVDNDYVNYCRIIEKDEEDFEEILELFKENGLGDCSLETDIAYFIEAVDNEENPTMFLVRV